MDQPEVAEAAAEAVLSSPYACPLFTQAAKVGLALLAVVRGDVAAAEHQYNTLEPSPCLEALGVLASDRLMGLLAQTMGNLDKAAEHFEEALAFSRRAGCRPELAWTCCDYADSVLQRNGPDDLSKANDLLEQALTIAELAHVVAGMFDPPPAVQIAKPPAEGQPPERYVPSTRRAQSELQLGQTIDLDTAVRKSITWHRQPLLAPQT